MPVNRINAWEQWVLVMVYKETEKPEFAAGRTTALFTLLIGRMIAALLGAAPRVRLRSGLAASRAVTSSAMVLAPSGRGLMFLGYKKI